MEQSMENNMETGTGAGSKNIVVSRDGGGR